MKECPFCAEKIQDDAIKCKYCGEFLSSTKIDSSDERQLKRPNDNYNCRQTNSSQLKLKCPRCGYSDTPDKFKDAYDNSTCCCLALLMVLPAILYYFFRQGKKICPKCKNLF